MVGGGEMFRQPEAGFGGRGSCSGIRGSLLRERDSGFGGVVDDGAESQVAGQVVEIGSGLGGTGM